jgi:hypothetical protein
MKSLLITLALIKPVCLAETKTTAMCCCRVAGGQMCCGETMICSGGYIPGCFCSLAYSEARR